MKYENIYFNNGEFYHYTNSEKVVLALVNKYGVICSFADFLPVPIAHYNKETGLITDNNGNKIAEISAYGVLYQFTTMHNPYLGRLDEESLCNLLNHVQKKEETVVQQTKKKM